MLIDKLHELGAIKFGSFKWVSGVEAPYYIDLRLVPSYPELFAELTSQLSSIVSSLPNYQNSILAGVPTAGLSFATAVARELGLPLIYVRKQEKSHGTKKMVEGMLKPEQEVIVIEDLVSKGGSIIKTSRTLRENGALVNNAVATIEHGVGGRQNIEKEGITLKTVTTTLKVAKYLNKKGKISPEELKTVQEFIDEQKNPNH